MGLVFTSGIKSHKPSKKVPRLTLFSFTPPAKLTRTIAQPPSRTDVNTTPFANARKAQCDTRQPVSVTANLRPNLLSRSHIRQAKRYLGCKLVHLCALTWDIPSRAVVRREENCSFTSCLPDILTAGLPSRRRVASLSLGPSDPWCARSSNSESAPPTRPRGGAGHVLGHAACQPLRGRP